MDVTLFLGTRSTAHPAPAWLSLVIKFLDDDGKLRHLAHVSSLCKRAVGKKVFNLERENNTKVTRNIHKTMTFHIHLINITVLVLLTAGT